MSHFQNNLQIEEYSDLSRGFSHYYRQLETGRSLKFGCLRKTYISNLKLLLGDNTKIITQHSDNAVIEKHYTDKKVIAFAARNFEVFPEKEERINELDQIRKGTSEREQPDLDR